MGARYPLAPLLQLTGWTVQRTRSIAPCGGEEYRRRLDEGVTEYVADRLATEAGYHPFEVWPEMAEHQRGAEEARRLEGRERRRRQQAEWARRKYQADAEHRANKIERDRAYKAEARKAVLAAQRLYRDNNAERVNAAKRAWHQRNRDDVLARRRARYQAEAQARRATVRPMTSEETAA